MSPISRARHQFRRWWLRPALGAARQRDSPASGSGPTITAGWHMLVRVWDGQQVRRYVNGLRTNTIATTATGSWTIYRQGRQFTGGKGLDEAYVPFFGASGAAWEDGMVARWSAIPRGMLWAEMDAWLAACETRCSWSWR